jgi:ribose transport system substrate-binding protein
MRNSIRSLLLVIVLMGFLNMSCQRGDPSSAEGPTIALVVKTLNHPFFIDMENGAREAAEKLGINLIVQGPEREIDVEKQMQIVENLIQRRVDAICLAPCGSKEIVPAIVKANRAKIPVITVDTRVDSMVLAESGGFIKTFIGSDNYEGGKIAGQYIGKVLKGRGEVAVLEGIPGHETGDARLKGFREALGKFEDIQIVASLTANWERDQGYNVFQNILQSHPGIQALFACNDLMALGAIEAIASMGKSGDISVVGFDALDDGLKTIQNGDMDGTIAQYPFEMGKHAVEYAYRVLQGESIPQWVPVRIELITKENVNSILSAQAND